MNDAETIRRLCHAEASRCRKTKAQKLKTSEKFDKGSGHGELQIDAGKVNTETGWRDVKVATSAVREPAELLCTSAKFGKRELPEPTVRDIIASIESVETFGPRCQRESIEIGLYDPTKLTVLSDGAEWIWNLAKDHFAGAE